MKKIKLFLFIFLNIFLSMPSLAQSNKEKTVRVVSDPWPGFALISTNRTTYAILSELN